MAKKNGAPSDMKSEIQKEVDALVSAHVGDPAAPFAKTAELSAEFVEKLNQGIAYHYTAANFSDSAAAYFGKDNVGLPGVSLFFKVCAVKDRADAWTAIDFLNKRGGELRFLDVEGPPDIKTWYQPKAPDVQMAFIKALASAKYGMALVDKLYAAAHKHHDSDAVAYVTRRACQDAEAVRVLSHFVAHLKVAGADKHAIKNFDRELAWQVQDMAKAAAIEAVIPARLQLGVMGRLLKTQAMEVQGGGFGKEPGRERTVYERATI